MAGYPMNAGAACDAKTLQQPTALQELSRSLAELNARTEVLADKLFGLEARTLGSPPPTPANPTAGSVEMFGGQFSGLFAQAREIQGKLSALHELADRLARIA